MTTTRRGFLAAVPAAVGGAAWAQTRPVKVNPLDAVTRELCLALRERPSLGTLTLAARVFASVAETSGMAARIDALVRQPGTTDTVLAALQDGKHATDRARALAFAPALGSLPMPDMSARREDVDRAVAFFKQHGFANALRQMADALPSDGDLERLDNCGAWGFSCLFWGVAEIFICLVPTLWGCIFGYLLDQWICYMWYYCEP